MVFMGRYVWEGREDSPVELQNQVVRFGPAAEDAEPAQGRLMSRRAALAGLVAGGAGLAVVGAAAWSGLRADSGRPVDARLIARVEAARRHSGRVRDVRLQTRRSEIDLGGRIVPALTYGGELPGAEIRVAAGDVLRADISNGLDQPTSVHWHGLAIRNDADGVPGVTAPELAPGARTRLEFVVPDAGTHWFHPHSGLQLDWGLYAPLIVEDPNEPGDYDHELVVVLDDWSPGLAATPEQNLAQLRAGGSMGAMPGMDQGDMAGMDHGGMAGMADAGDVEYPAYLANGRLPQAPRSLTGKPGQRVRLRLINAAADTTFDVALGGHRLTVTHSDGYLVQPVTVDTVRIAMGERYDATVTLGDGVFPLTAVPLGKQGTPARVVLRSGAGAVPGLTAVPGELSRRRLNLADLVADMSVRLDRGTPDTVHDVVLGGDMATYRWTINGRVYEDTEPIAVRYGKLSRLRLVNRTRMLHPVHLHGHTFALSPPHGARKDTVLVPAMETVTVDVLADNPGRWMLHCHNAFHMEAGMMTRLEYRT
jgi:FtsP/CotA-like multicopper oxidase with cupredoxin domain